MVGICLYARGWANLDSLRLGIRYLVTYSGAKFEVATSNGLGGDEFTRNHYLTFDLAAKVTRNVARYPLYHVTYSGTKF